MLRVRSAGDIFQALRSHDPGIRFSILRAIVNAPAKAASYGMHEGKDLVDELCEQFVSLSESPLRTMVLGALSEFRDPRARAVFAKMVMVSNDSTTVSLSARYLALEPEEEVRQIFSSLLLQDNSLVHARCAANSMTRFEHLTGRERIRIAVLCDGDFSAPLLSPGTEEAWTEELRGPFYERTRLLLEGQGEPAFLFLRKMRDRLSPESRKWLLVWGTRDHPAFSVELILQTLDSGETHLLLTALECIAALGEASAIFSGITGKFLSHPDPLIRLAAVRAGAVGIDWESGLFRETDVPVRIEMAGRLADEKGTAAVPALLRLLEEKDLRIRAAATAVLQRLGKDAADGVKPLIEHPDPAVKVAAAQVLLATGEEHWLEEKLLS